MKTGTEAAPAERPAANLTVQQLAKTLTKPTPSQATTEKTEPEVTTPAADREEPPINEDAGEGAEGADLSQTATTETLTEGDAAPAAEAAASAEQPVKTELPAELADAIELAKGDGKKGVADLLKRVHKLVDERDTNRNARLEAEERTRQLEAQLEEQQTKPAADPAPSASHPAIAAVNQQLAEVNGFLQLFRDNPQGVEIDDGEGGKTYLDADTIAEHAENLRNRKTELLTERTVLTERVKEAFQEAHAKAHAVAVKKFPWLANPKDPQTQRMERILKVVPEVKRFPDYELVIGYYFKGLASDQAAKPKPTLGREPTKVLTEAPSAAAGAGDAKSAAQREVKAAEEQFRKTGKADDLRKFESAKRKLARLG